MPTLTIDNQQITVADGATILDAARQAGIEIPTLCHLKGLAAPTTCLVCVVQVRGMARLVPACATNATEGMVVESESAEVRAARKMALELLLGDHLGDCLAPCQGACPAQVEIPTLLHQIAAGRLPEALDAVSHPFPATLGRICPAPCERGCRRTPRDGAVDIRRLERFIGDTALTKTPVSAHPSSGKRVAIVGAGLAGLTAASLLQRAGHACTVFEANAAAGGTARTPEAADVLDAEIAAITRLGVELRLQSPQGGKTLDALRREFATVLFATGAAALPSPLGTPDAATLATALPGVFALPPAPRAPAPAVGQGRLAAHVIGQYLAEQPLVGTERPFSVHIGKIHEEEWPALLTGANTAHRQTPDDTQPFTPEDAPPAARRCLHCDCGKLHDCRLRDYAIAYHASPARFKGERRRFTQDRTHPAVIYEPGKCIACGRCVQITAQAGEALGLTFVGRGFTVRVAAPFDAPLVDALTDAARACVDACPTGALVMKEEKG